MKLKNQQGFTLIELMIVVAIIGILAAIAIPAYQDYTVKAKVGESVTLSAPSRTALGISCSEGTLVGSMTNDHADLSLEASATYTGNYVTSVLVSDTATSTGLIIVTLTGIGSQIASGSTVTYTGACTTGGLTWSISGSGVSTKYLPKS